MLRELIRAGLVSSAHACDQGMLVEDASRSNPVYLVLSESGPNVVVKQAAATADGGSPIEAERAIYRWLESHVDVSMIAPKQFNVPGRERWLVIEAIDQSRPLYAQIAAWPDSLRPVLEALAEKLARLHREAIGNAESSCLPRSRPWILEPDTRQFPGFVTGNSTVSAFASELTKRPSIAAVVQARAASWRDECVIHGDLKSDNILVAGEIDSPAIHLIDWELAGTGDPIWDLASLVEIVVHFACEGPNDLRSTLDRAPLQEALGVYQHAVGAAELPVERIVEALVARLVQSSIQLEGMAVSNSDFRSPQSTLLAILDALVGDLESAAAALAGA